MNQKEIVSGISVEPHDDPKRKTHVLPSHLEGIYSPSQMFLVDDKKGQAAVQEEGPAALPTSSARLPDAGTMNPEHAARETHSANSRPSVPLYFAEEIKPWMVLAFGDGRLTAGLAGDYGLQRVWDDGLRGQGVKVGVDDTGLVRGHADFDYAQVDSDGYFLTPGENGEAVDGHGTAVAGIIAARSNGFGVVGVAHESTLWTANYRDVQTSSVVEALRERCDVLNMSWGVRAADLVELLNDRVYYDSHFRVAERGRNGLGMSLVSSAGNKRNFGGDAGVQPDTNHENVIAVAAVDFTSRVEHGSTPGESVHVAAPGENAAVANANDPTGMSLFKKSGTSYAAPFVSGVVALMYQANPGLGLRDVQEILAHGARLPLGGMSAGFSFNRGRHANGGGWHFSYDYGFGLVNAHHSARLAESWFIGGPAAKTGTNRQRAEISTYRRIGDHGQRFALKFTLADALEVEHVKLRLDLDVEEIKNVKFVLISPQGTESVLMENYGDEEMRTFNGVIDLGSRRFWGEQAAGEWTLNVICTDALNDLRGATLIVSGSADTQDDRYVYTNAFNYLAMQDPRRLLLEDNDGGDDTFNAACLTDNIVVDLGAGLFRFGDGPQGRIAAGTVIENVVGGDGNDTLSGSAGNDVLYGGRGADTLAGRAGDDTYIVNDALDVITELAEEGDDTVESSVSYVLGANLENLVLTGTDDIDGVGNALDNYLIGNDANNRLDGASGNDTLIGGEGDDVYFVRAGDVVVEDAFSGDDTVISDVSWTLGEHVENLLLTGANALGATGNDLDNILVGNRAGDVLSGAAGNDLLKGGSGEDALSAWVGPVLFDGGSGNDSMEGGASAELYLGGQGNDRLSSGAGDDVILFNAGDGQDALFSKGSGRKTLSLGGDFAYGDLVFRQSGEHLVLGMGQADQITFENWYAATPSRPVVKLQVIAESMSGFNAGGSDPLLDQKVEHFDFAGLVGAFDAARTAMPTLSSWVLTDALHNFQKAGSDSAAIGGELAYQYGRHGTLSAIGLSAAQEIISDSRFGTQAQDLRPLSELQGGTLRMR